jgi:hypothetical protein
MGWSLAWIAVRGKSPEQVRHELGTEPTGVTSEICAESELSATELGGWYLVASNHDRSNLLDEARLARLARGCEIVTCFVEEHVMVSSSSSWRDGARLWRVTHDAQDDLGLEHLEVGGSAPPELAAIRARGFEELRADPEPCDYVFDVPVNLAAKLVGGFRHDEGDYTFAELRSVSKEPRKSWLRRLIGR